MSGPNYDSKNYTAAVEEYLNYTGLRGSTSEADTSTISPNERVSKTFNQVYDSIDKGTMDPQGRNSMQRPAVEAAQPLRFEDTIVPPPKNPALIDPESKAGKILHEAGTILGEHAKATLDVLKAPGDALKGNLTDEEIAKKARTMGWMMGWPMSPMPMAKFEDYQNTVRRDSRYADGIDRSNQSITDAHQGGWYDQILGTVSKMSPEMKERFKQWMDTFPLSENIEDRRAPLLEHNETIPRKRQSDLL